MLVGYTKGRDETLTEAFRTQVVLNSLNPTWIAKHYYIPVWSCSDVGVGFVSVSLYFPQPNMSFNGFTLF